MHYVTDQHPDHPGEMWLCDLETGAALSALPGVRATTFALTADGGRQRPSLSTGIARALVAAGDWDEVITADAGSGTPWASDPGIAYVDTPTSDKRQLESGGMSARAFPQPLMAQVATAWGHDGAIIVGRIDEATIVGKALKATGVLSSNDFGTQVAGLINDQMLRGISIDLGDISVETEVIEETDDGWIIDWLDHFTEWELMGATITPWPAFADARVKTTGDVVAEAEAVAAAAARPQTLTIPLAAPAGWFAVEEPRPGATFGHGGMGEEWLIEQDAAGSLACPLHILDDGRVFGHIAYWGQRHVGFPGGNVTPPDSPSAYSKFMVGYHVCDDGTEVATGVLTAGCDHASTRLRAPEATSHYAHNGVGWADVHVTDGVYGPWAVGVLRPDVTPEQVRVLRAGALSGDWRKMDGPLEMIATLAVNTPGFPIAREAVTAAAFETFESQRQQVLVADGELQALTAAGVVRRCRECQQRAIAACAEGVCEVPVMTRIDALEAKMLRLERVTAPLMKVAADSIARP